MLFHRASARPRTRLRLHLHRASPAAGAPPPRRYGRREEAAAARRLRGAVDAPAEPLRRRRAGLRRAGGALPVLPPLRLRHRPRPRVRRLHRLLRHPGAHARAPPPRPWRQLVGVTGSPPPFTLLPSALSMNPSMIPCAVFAAGCDHSLHLAHGIHETDKYCDGCMKFELFYCCILSEGAYPTCLGLKGYVVVVVVVVYFQYLRLIVRLQTATHLTFWLKRNIHLVFYACCIALYYIFCA